MISYFKKLINFKKNADQLIDAQEKIQQLEKLIKELKTRYVF